MPGAEILGPATLAYLESPAFAPAATDAVGSTAIGPETEARKTRPDRTTRVRSGSVTCTPPSSVTYAGDGVLSSACGYRTWPGALAHMCVLTRPDSSRPRPGQAVASAATAHALDAGLLPQWRARPADSRAVAAALGYTYRATS